MDTFTGISNDELADQICTWAGRLAAGEARLLALIGEFDRREAWGGPGLLSCAHWLTWMTGLSPNAARERVRVARALPLLPLLNEAFTAGKVSWSQVRAVTRVATAENEEDLLHAARHSTAAQLERITRGIRRVERYEEARADPREAAYRMRARCWYDADGDLVLSVRMPAEHGVVLLAAIEQARAELDRLRLREAGLGDVSAETPLPLFGGFGEDRERLPLPPFRLVAAPSGAADADATPTAAAVPAREARGADEPAACTPGVSAETPHGGKGLGSGRVGRLPERSAAATQSEELGTLGADDADDAGLLNGPDASSAEASLGGATGAAGDEAEGRPGADPPDSGTTSPVAGDDDVSAETRPALPAAPALPAESERAEPGRAEPGRAELERAEPERAEPDRAEPQLAESGPTAPPPSAAEPPRAATVADAVLEIARSFIAHQAAARPDSVRRHRAALTIHIDPLSGWGRLRDGELLPPETLAAVQRTLAAAGAGPQTSRPAALPKACGP